MRLVVEADFAGCQRPAQVVFQDPAPLEAFVHFRGEEAVDTPPSLFRLIQRHIGLLGQLGGWHVAVTERDAHAQADEYLLTIQNKRGADSLDQPRGDALDLQGIGNLRQDNDELITPDAGEGVALTQVGA